MIKRIRFITIIIGITLPSLLFADGIHAYFELFIATKGIHSSYTVNINVNKIGITWNDSYEIEGGYNGHTFTFIGSSIQNLSDRWSDGFDFVTSTGGGPTGNQYGGIVAYGVYKVSTTYNDKYFYIDYRDCRYINSSQAPYNDIMDIFILFDGNFEYTTSSSENPYTSISNGQVVGVWEMFGVGTPNQSCFEGEFDLNITQSNNHPYLSWNNANYSIIYYEIWKKKGTGNWSLFTTTSNSHYEDTGETITLSGGEKVYVHYKIRAKIKSNVFSLFSNSERIAVHEYGQVEKRLPGSYTYKETTEANKQFILKENYPNPFNPITYISFYLPEEQIVTLKVYDTTGQIVANLIETKIMSSGEHTLVFKAGKIPSGLYFYELKTNNFRKINRMLFLK
ncbi:MAG: T9SS type A sorting domain-containing protein [Bacteroidales bacterium]|nr:T9SS type A sorting domain-containing protein [Bacteroidales bacterium]